MSYIYIHSILLATYTVCNYLYSRGSWFAQDAKVVFEEARDGVLIFMRRAALCSGPTWSFIVG